MECRDRGCAFIAGIGCIRRHDIKLLRGEVATPETLRRFVREARAASAVRHPNVVEIHDILTLDDGSPAMVMDLLEGETLAQIRASGLALLPYFPLASGLLSGKYARGRPLPAGATAGGGSG